MSINIYKNLDLLGKIMRDLFDGEDIKDRALMMVLIYEGGISQKKIKIGGKLAKLVKNNIEGIKGIVESQKGIRAREDEENGVR